MCSPQKGISAHFISACVCLSVCGHMCRHTCVHIHVEARKLMCSVSLDGSSPSVWRQGLSLNTKLANLACLASWPAPRTPYLHS